MRQTEAQRVERLHAVRGAAITSLVFTAIVVTIKLAAAHYSRSVSVLAEGLQSLIDVATAAIAVLTISLAAKPADEDHPYGHGRLEVLASALQMVVVIGSAGVIAWQAALRILQPSDIRADIGLYAMAVSALINAFVIRHLQKVAAKYGSANLRAESQHLLGDLLATLGVLIGLAATWATGLKILDPVFAILFVTLSAVHAIRELLGLTHQLMDGSLPAEDILLVKTALDLHPEVKGYHNLRTRQTGELRIVTMHVLLDDHLSFIDAHDLAEQIEAEVSDTLGGALVTIHYEPNESELEHRAKHHSE